MDLEKMIRVIPDFPKPGISFKDITPVLNDPKALCAAIDLMAETVKGRDFDIIVCPEARGFIIAAPLAYKLGVGLAPVRKAGKLPYRTVKGQYNLEYGTDTLELHEDAVKPGQRVLVVDDVLATGGTIGAVINLVEKLDGIVDAAAFFIELKYIPGRDNLKKYPVYAALELSS